MMRFLSYLILIIFVLTISSFASSMPSQLIIHEGIYKGEMEFIDGKWVATGKGSVVFANGRYEGEFLLNQYDGFGIRTWNNGEKYAGTFKRGKYHGIGYLKQETRTVKGWFENSVLHGAAIIDSKNYRFVGNFKHGKKEGYGIEQGFGSQYRGTYKKDKRFDGIQVKTINEKKGTRYEQITWKNGKAVETKALAKWNSKRALAINPSTTESILFEQSFNWYGNEMYDLSQLNTDQAEDWIWEITSNYDYSSEMKHQMVVGDMKNNQTQKKTASETTMEFKSICNQYQNPDNKELCQTFENK